MMTILSARYANAERTAAVIQTVENAAVAISARDTPALWAQMLATVDPDSYVAPPVSFRAGDMIDLLTTADLVAIEAAVAGNVDLRLLWVRLRSRGDKLVATDAEAFVQGWAGLKQALGATRSAEIAAVLGIPH
jgi:hypothetical protein